jgi:hypothetical protein
MKAIIFLAASLASLTAGHTIFAQLESQGKTYGETLSLSLVSTPHHVRGLALFDCYF